MVMLWDWVLDILNKRVTIHLGLQIAREMSTSCFLHCTFRLPSDQKENQSSQLLHLVYRGKSNLVYRNKLPLLLSMEMNLVTYKYLHIQVLEDGQQNTVLTILLHKGQGSFFTPSLDRCFFGPQFPESPTWQSNSYCCLWDSGRCSPENNVYSSHVYLSFILCRQESISPVSQNSFLWGIHLRAPHSSLCLD